MEPINRKKSVLKVLLAIINPSLAASDIDVSPIFCLARASKYKYLTYGLFSRSGPAPKKGKNSILILSATTTTESLASLSDPLFSPSLFRSAPLPEGLYSNLNDGSLSGLVCLLWLSI